MKNRLPRDIVIATNNGDIGGGEVMLLALARELTGLGLTVAIVGPSSPAGLVDTARERGFETVVLEASTRLEYLHALRRWDRRERAGVLWCNGLLPSVATAGGRRRIAHLHQRPRGVQRLLARIARWGTIATVVPSLNMASAIKGSVVLQNWVPGMGEPGDRTLTRALGAPIRIGFLGRPSSDKGVEVLADALRTLDRETPRRYRLIIGGESRFVAQASRSAVGAALASLGNLVEQTGWIAPKDFFGRIDILACPSIWPESFGLVVAESMSARIPVVVSEAGALPEVVGPGHPWIARSGDSEDLARKLRAAAEGDSVAVENAFMRWETQYSPEAGRQRLRLLLRRLDIPVTDRKKVGP